MKKKLGVKMASIIMLFFISCSKDNDVTDPPQPVLETDVSIDGFLFTNKGNYTTGESVTLNAFSIKNTSTTKVSITSVEARLVNFKTPNNNAHIFELANNFEIPVGNSHNIESQIIVTIPSGFQKEAHGLYIDVKFSSGAIKKFYKTFFRVSDAETQMVYEINEEDYQGLPVFKLKNGLSAEYAIQKSTASFMSGISHSWETPLAPIASTPDFLERSIDKTVAFYNNALGSSTSIETVIISTGIPGVPYVARAMKAIVLPLHFLVGSGTVKEIQTILEHANNNGYSTYGTLGYDFSISTTTGVAWIKLLDLPEQYKKFIADHNVQNVILYGHSGVNDGETGARKVIDNTGQYEPGSLYLMHFSGSESQGFLEQVISDFDTSILKTEEKIADWEAGIIQDQITNFSSTINTDTAVSTIKSVTSNDGVNLWNMGTFSTLAFINKNKAAFEVGGDAVRGVSLNPYLIAHPTYESWMRYVPFLYWQGFSAEFQYNNWLSTKIKTAVNMYFPNIEFNALTFHVNSTNNFGGASQGNSMVNFLSSRGHMVTQNNFSFDEVWDTANGLGTPSEVRAKQIVDAATASEYKTWNDGLQYLMPSDLEDIESKFPEIVVQNH